MGWLEDILATIYGTGGKTLGGMRGSAAQDLENILKRTGLRDDVSVDPTGLTAVGGQDMIPSEAWKMLDVPAPPDMSGGYPIGPPVDESRVYDRVTPPTPQPEQNSWEAFVAMNPNLDYDKVAQQAGGIPGSFPVENEFGGAISEMPDSPERQAQEEEFYDFVNNKIPQMEIERKLDPRSRAYDPEGAAQLIQLMKTTQDAEAISAQSAIEQVKAAAAMKEAEAYSKLAEGGLNSGGYPFGGGQQQQPDNWAQQYNDFADALATLPDSQEHPQAEVSRDIISIKGALAVGNREAAEKIISKYLNTGGAAIDPENAGPPPGIKSGERYVAPNGELLTAP